MRIRILAIGQKMPDWVNQAWQDYARRISGDCQLSLLELPMQKRGKNQSVAQYRSKESQQILDALRHDEMLVALDVEGKAISTTQLAGLLTDWQMSGRHVALAIGGPDGFDDAVRQRADVCLSLSKLTLPHPLVRVLVAEQLYRAWSINHGHPYHR
ncbi:MAG TPA: 23S rRNA (pseudouridine(1915)-N(3))-methyltransferase RlmH [Pseudomonadales bacterium]